MIKLLDQTTIDKIAAGEVIERPSSVVKELLENSIDAGATIITTEIKEGGLSLIRVTDNGSGIPVNEVKTAYMRHATSKIESAHDLERIGSLGFRGEALSTIAAVSQTEMITKTSEAVYGVKYVIHGGNEIEFTEVGVPDGTTIVVKNLFFNTPARKKFLKSSMTEGSYIQELVLRLALSHPEISFKLIANGQTRIDTIGNGKLKDRVYQLFGRDITNNLLEISADNGNIKLSGFIGKPYISRGNRGFENYFINKRYIKSQVINRAIEEGYKTFIMQHKFPFTVLNVELPKDKCDVNVHPTKMEFKYDNDRELFEIITQAVKEALTRRELIPAADYKDKPSEKLINQPGPALQKTNPKPVEPYEQKRASAVTAAKAYGNSYRILEALKENTEQIKTEPVKSEPVKSEPVKSEPLKSGTVTAAPVKAATIRAYQTVAEPTLVAEEGPAYSLVSESKGVYYNSGEQQTLFDDKFISEKARAKHKLIGQLFDTYWLIEYEDKLFIMDQHAAHEKVKYEELMSNLSSRDNFSQQLSPPLVVTVSYRERQTVLDHFDLFFKTGFDIEEFGGNEFKINAVPVNIYGLQGRTMFLDFVSSLMETQGYISNDIFIKKLSTMACKAAVKGNMKLGYAEANALLDQLLKLENPYTCPHGRPTIISMSKEELEKKFKRIV